MEMVWSSKFGYYFTYFGDVYYGIAVQIDMNQDGFYIVSKNQFQEYNNLLTTNGNKDHLERLGTYIPSKSIIQEWKWEEQFKPSPGSNKNVPWGGDPNSYKRMYVFGAGASANCLFGEGKAILEQSKMRPPLGPELFAPRFDDYIAKYPGLKMILPKFESKGNDIEAILEDDWTDLMKKENRKLAAQHMQLQFYLQELFGIISEVTAETNYRYSLPTLFADNLQRIQSVDNKSVIVSFNYDTILERAFEKQFDIQFDNIDQYVNQGENNNFLFFKPHGSWNWGWEFDKTKLIDLQIDIPTWLFKNNSTPSTVYYDYLEPEMLNYSSWGIEAGNHPNAIGRYTPNREKIKVTKTSHRFFPAILLPYRDKDEFVMPYLHQIQMLNIIPYIEELVLIGWKGSEKLFNTQLQRKAVKLKKITIVNPASEDVKKEMSHYFELNKYDIQEIENFEQYVSNNMK